MRIDAYNQVAQIYNLHNAQKTQKAATKQSVRDQLQISQAGRDYQIAKKAVLTTPPVSFSLNVQLQVVKEPWQLFSKASVCAVVLTSLIPRAPPVFSLIY